MRTAIKLILLLLLMPSCLSAQGEEDFPSLEYLRNDYKAVAVVVHVQIREAEISGRVGGYENWRVLCEVLEPFKGKFLKGEVIEYFHGAEAGFKKEYFIGEKIVFLLADYDRKKTYRYSVLENSTLPPTADRLTKLRALKKSFAKKRSRVRHNHADLIGAQRPLELPRLVRIKALYSKMGSKNDRRKNTYQTPIGQKWEEYQQAKLRNA